MEFKDKLKSLRAEKKISQQALADAIFISRSAVAKWESGLGLPSEDSMTALCNYFGVTADYFSTEQAEDLIVNKNKTIRRLWCGLAALAAALLIVIPLLLIFGSRSESPAKVYTYTGESRFPDTDLDKFTIAINNDGTFTYYETLFSSHLGFGEWTLEDDVLTITESAKSITADGQIIEVKRQNRFLVDGDDLIFIEDGSDNFIYVKVKNGERFTCE